MLLERWTITGLGDLKCNPCEPNPGTGEMRIFATPARPRPMAEPNPTERPEGTEPQHRRMQILASDIRDHGYTIGCPACGNLKRNIATRKGHNEACRSRIMQELAKSDSGRQRLEREGQRVNQNLADHIAREVGTDSKTDLN